MADEIAVSAPRMGTVLRELGKVVAFLNDCDRVGVSLAPFLPAPGETAAMIDAFIDTAKVWGFTPDAPTKADPDPTHCRIDAGCIRDTGHAEDCLIPPGPVDERAGIVYGLVIKVSNCATDDWEEIATLEMDKPDFMTLVMHGIPPLNQINELPPHIFERLAIHGGGMVELVMRGQNERVFHRGTIHAELYG